MTFNKCDLYNADCKHFAGDIPCRFHKDEGVHCNDCSHYDPQNEIILIIKLGAIGDVIRTTPLIRKIQVEKPHAAIWWLTQYPELLPDIIDRILPFTIESLALLEGVDFSWIINLDKDPHAASLASKLNSAKVSGFILKNGKIAPADDLARHKLLTGIWDDCNKSNKKSYPEEIFEICDWQFSGEEYLIRYGSEKKFEFNDSGKSVIGLNTGCSERWLSRRWGENNWKLLIKKLNKEGFFPLLLGGEQEHAMNKSLASATGAYYPGHYSLQDFLALVGSCQLVVTGVTMAMHFAIALRKKVVLLNNIFNPAEFELYGRGRVIEPEIPCKCFYSSQCKNPEYFCMDHLSPDRVFVAIKELMN